ncbi:MAG: hypothetical protein IID54_06615 [Proteobacteria bacterium]|nr:hypothetical protein [Pseudomonadota bacterium]
MVDDEREQGADAAAPGDAQQPEASPVRRWWVIPLAFVGAVAIKYFARRGQVPAPRAPGKESERIKDAEFRVKK